MTDRFNTIAGWVLFAGIVALGASIVSSEVFHQERPEEMGYPIEGVVVEGEAGEAEKPRRLEPGGETRSSLDPASVGERGDSMQGVRRLAIPAKATVVDLVAGRVVVKLDEAWTAGAALPTGSLAQLDLTAALVR